ncbi:type IV secretory system conjugative DNA transfer family protein [Staphylococcus aureus]
MKKYVIQFLISLILAEIILFACSYLYACFEITKDVMYLSVTITDKLKDFFDIQSKGFGDIRLEFLKSIKVQFVGFCLALVLQWQLFNRKKEERAGAKKSDNQTYGDSQIADDKEIAPLKKYNGTYLLGKHKNKYVYQPNKSKMNRHVLINAPTASGKTTSYSIPNIKLIADRGESFISTDTKGDTYNATSQYLKNNGYDIKVINLIDMTKSDSLNPFDFIETLTDAQNFIDSFLKSTGVSTSDESYWDRAESLYMSTLVLYVVNHFEPQYRNIPNWINLYLEIGDNVDKRNMIFDAIEDDRDLAKRSYQLYRVNTSSKVESSILLGISSRMQYFLDRNTEQLLSKSDFRYEDIANDKTAVFIITQERDIISNIVSSVIMTQTIDKLIDLANTLPSLSFPKPIHIMADEFGNIAKLKQFANTLTTVRAKNVIITAIIQELNQIKVKYKDDYNTILSSFDTKVLMGTTDTDTRDYFIKLGGEYTADIFSDNEKDDEHSTSTRIGQIAAINKSMINQLDTNNQNMVFVRGYNTMILERTYFFEEKDFKNVLPQSDWHNIPTKNVVVNYKSLNINSENNIMNNDHYNQKDLADLEHDEESPIYKDDEVKNFKGFGKW